MRQKAFTRRGRLEIIYNILSLCQKPVQKTYIMYQVNLSYTQLKKYINYLIQANLLDLKNTEQEELYTVTEKGKNLIEEYIKLLELLE